MNAIVPYISPSLGIKQACQLVVMREPENDENVTLITLRNITLVLHNLLYVYFNNKQY